MIWVLAYLVLGLATAIYLRLEAKEPQLMTDLLFYGLLAWPISWLLIGVHLISQSEFWKVKI